MSNIGAKKKEARNKIADLKSKYSQEELFALSEEVLLTLEMTDAFQQAKTVLLYNSMPDEVNTSGLIERWKGVKNIYLPVVKGDDMVFRKVDENTQFEKSNYGILEPIGDDFTNFSKVDVVVVPGVAFDRNLNRLGRGKAFYDKFLRQLKALKIGICFDFQLLETIPTDGSDIPMNYVVSENDLIWK